MRIPSYIFWSILILMAIFYIEVGNDMKKERQEVLTPKVKISSDINSTK